MTPRSRRLTIGTGPVILAAALTVGAGPLSLAETRSSQISRPLAQQKVEAVPAPRAGSVWVPGMAISDGRRYHWVPGHWELPRSSRTWRPPHWEMRGGGQVWVPGQWIEAAPPPPPAPSPQPAPVQSPPPTPPPPQPPPEESIPPSATSASKASAQNSGSADPWANDQAGQGARGAAPEPGSAPSPVAEPSPPDVPTSSSEISFTEAPFPKVIGGTWSNGTEALKHMAISAESKALPGIELVAAMVSLSSKVGEVDAVQIETRDGNHIARVLMRYSQALASHCNSFGSALRKAATGKWTGWKVTGGRGKDVEIRARLAGEEVLFAMCGPTSGVFVRLDDAWTALPTTFKGTGDNAAGEVVWNMVNNDIAASRATNSFVTKDDVRGVTAELRRILANVGNLKSLSPRSLEAFEMFRAMAGSEAWITAQFKLGLAQR